MIDDPILIHDWHAVIPVAQLDAERIVRVRLLEEDIVIWRAGEQVLAWKDLCMHRGSRLSLGEIHGETLMCAYHGWTYNTDGQCVRFPALQDQTPPAKARVTTYRACIAYEFVWVCLGTPKYDLPPFPEWQDETYRRILCGPYTFKAAGPRMVENFLDVAHFPFVHENILGVREYTEIADYDVVTDENGVTAKNIDIYQPNPDGTGEGKVVRYTYQVFRPLVAYFRKETAGPSFAIMLMVTPIEEVHSLMWMWMVMNHSYDKSEAELRAFQDEIALQDLPIVESQRPELLPLDLQDELHLRSDKTAIAYRRWLNELGLTFGTS
jgi:phenylpropionate dioxygenase-like ring-hydroxylating dioxygenase large terminal subunit